MLDRAESYALYFGLLAGVAVVFGLAVVLLARRAGRYDPRGE